MVGSRCSCVLHENVATGTYVNDFIRRMKYTYASHATYAAVYAK